MVVLGVVSPKGGLGKTTLALNLSYAFAVRGWRTALADVDPQGGVGFSLVGRAREAPGFAGWLVGFRLCLVKTRNTHLTLLPVGVVPWGNAVQWGASLALTASSSGGWPRPLRERVDVLVIDTPSGVIGPDRGRAPFCDTPAAAGAGRAAGAAGRARVCWRRSGRSRRPGRRRGWRRWC